MANSEGPPTLVSWYDLIGSPMIFLTASFHDSLPVFFHELISEVMIMIPRITVEPPVQWQRGCSTAKVCRWQRQSPVQLSKHKSQGRPRVGRFSEPNAVLKQRDVSGVELKPH